MKAGLSTNQARELAFWRELCPDLTIEDKAAPPSPELGSLERHNLLLRREGYINVPCRYMNLIMRGMVQNELDSGLARLKTLTEQLPNVNFEGLDPQFDLIEPQAEAPEAPAQPAVIDPAENGSPPLVGRYAERERLVALLAAAADKRQQRIVVISGEPGIGKSRLLAELVAAARARGGTVLDIGQDRDSVAIGGGARAGPPRRRFGLSLRRGDGFPCGGVIG